MPLVAANTDTLVATNPVAFHISMCWYLSENLQVFQSDPSCFQQPLGEILSQIDFRKILFSTGHWLLNSVICGFWKSIRKQRFYTSLIVVVHYFFYRVIYIYVHAFEISTFKPDSRKISPFFPNQFAILSRQVNREFYASNILLFK